jgi:hypothetical protein
MAFLWWIFEADGGAHRAAQNGFLKKHFATNPGRFLSISTDPLINHGISDWAKKSCGVVHAPRPSAQSPCDPQEISEIYIRESINKVIPWSTALAVILSA